MVLNRIRTIFQASVLCAAALFGSAQAAVYTGSWDPSYGAPFPNLGWRGSVTVETPDGCGTIGGTLVACANGPMRITSGMVEFYDYGLDKDGPWFATVDFSTLAGQQSVLSAMEFDGVGRLIGITGAFLMPWKPDLSPVKNVSYGDDTYFWLAFNGGPQMFHVTCSNDSVGSLKTNGAEVLSFLTGGTMDGGVGGWINSNYNGQYGRVESSGWNSDDKGNGGTGPLAWTAGGFTQQVNDVPEPGSLALALSALGAGWLVRRRRASKSL